MQAANDLSYREEETLARRGSLWTTMRVAWEARLFGLLFEFAPDAVACEHGCVVEARVSYQVDSSSRVHHPSLSLNVKLKTYIAKALLNPVSNLRMTSNRSVIFQVLLSSLHDVLESEPLAWSLLKAIVARQLTIASKYVRRCSSHDYHNSNITHRVKEQS
jgi:hypothetical protein